MRETTISTLQRVVITGVGCVSPLGLGREAYFEGLREGRSGLGIITRFDPAGLACRIAGEVRGLVAEDYLPTKELVHVPRTVPMALAAAGEALRDAGVEPEEMNLEERRNVAVIVGSGGGGVEFAERQYELYFAGRDRQASVYAVPSITMGSLSSEISMAFGFKGLSHVVSTGCTSSTDALGYAAQQIKLGRAEMVVSGGVDAPITPAVLKGFCMMRVVASRWNESPEAGSRPFSKDREGFVLGEGAWFFVLEPLARARARGANIYAEIAGYGGTCDAHHRVRLDESGEEPARAMALALADAGLPAEAVDYVNLHGTSTVLNDRVETRAVKLALGKRAYEVPTSATKSQIGHPQGASGAAGVAATISAMASGWIPPTLNLDAPDPECDLDYVPNTARRHNIETALCNCIGFGSKNASLMLKTLPDN